MIILNGKQTNVAAKTVAELVTELNLPALGLVIEHNGTILKQTDWSNTPLKENDRIELISFVGGG
jgi:thiamine biosynthesis protein ThiS